MSADQKPSDHDLIRDLAKLLDETGLTEIEIERGGTRVRVGRQPAAISNVSVPVVPAAVAAQPATAPRAADPAQHPGAVLSPMVGTAYRAGEPGGMPFVDVGSKVKAGDTLLIIEAMKTMNHIPAPRSGTVAQVMIEDGHPVEFGELLMIVE
jgi:acetyl-CoA carboxylase biotin carboxyl carrier protein